VPRVELAAATVEDLDGLVRTHSLPPDTRPCRQVAAIALSVPEVRTTPGGTLGGFRFILGPWRWLILVYIYIEEDDRVVLVTVQDGCSSTGATGSRP
jgi:hypothetical protein